MQKICDVWENNLLTLLTISKRRLNIQKDILVITLFIIAFVIIVIILFGKHHSISIFKILK